MHTTRQSLLQVIEITTLSDTHHRWMHVATGISWTWGKIGRPSR